MSRLTLALDVMGGDFGTRVTVPAAMQALAIYSDLKLLLVGQQDDIKQCITATSENNNYSADVLSRLEIIPAEKQITTQMKPSQAIRASKGTSMRIALELVKEGKADGCVSAGNTGALLGLSKLLVKPLEGIERPALMSLLPHKCRGETVMLDLGANLVCDATLLTQFAIMGSVMAEEVLQIKQPRVALLNVGEEEEKGLDNIKIAAQNLKARDDIHYIGFIEGDALLAGEADVIVCDGFAGNVALKTLEGILRLFGDMLGSKKKKRSIFMGLMSKLIKARMKKRFGDLNPDQYNGASLLGLGRVVIKSHGGANQRAFLMAIQQAVLSVQRDIPTRIRARLEAVLPKSE